VRGVVRAKTTPFVVWAMPDARCKQRDDRCAGRPTGIAAFDKGGNELGEPTWKLAGHPAERLDRALSVSETGRVDLIARSNAEGALELSRFRLPLSAAEPTTPGEHATIEPAEHWAISGAQVPEASASSAVLVPGEPSAVLHARDTPEGVQATLAWATEGTAAVPLMAAAGTGAWTLACELSESRYLAYGSTTELRIARADAAHAVEQLVTLPAALPSVLDADNPSLDQARWVCDASKARFLYTDDKHDLTEIRCDAQGCGPGQLVAHNVSSFSAVAFGDDTIVAYSGGTASPTIRIARLDARGLPLMAAATPGACWEPYGGMCGTPLLVRDTQRIVLIARDGADLLALESTDRGQTFAALSGVMTKAAFEPSGASPMQQHRLKKGLN
jgi:hypothetical protein